MKLITNAQRAIRNINFKKAQLYTLLLCAALLSSGDSQDVNAQAIFHPSTTVDYQYPTAAMLSSTTYNLDVTANKYLSNNAFPSIRFPDDLFVSGWSSTTDGGFTYGYIDRTTGVFTGVDAEAIDHARDVQVGIMEVDDHTCIVAAYYNNSVQNYEYRLYEWNATPPLTLLTTFTFSDPLYPNLPASVASTMDYNRISMDISASGERVAIVMTDGATDNMYTTVGQLLSGPSGAFIQFCPNLSYPGLSISPGLPPPSPSPFPSWYDPAAVFYDYVLGLWTYQPPYNPLINLRPYGGCTVPSTFPEYKLQWPDVTFNGDNELTFAFYVPGLKSGAVAYWQSIYVLPNMLFSNLYTYVNSGGAFGLNYPEYYEIATHTERGLTGQAIFDYWISSCGIGPSNFIPLTTGEELRVKLDAPDMSTGSWALTYSNKSCSFLGNNNINVRYFNGTLNREAIVNNGSLGNFDISSFTNINPTIAYNPAADRLHVAWGSEGFPEITTASVHSIIGLEIDPFTPYSMATDASITTTNDYLIVPFDPNYSFGDNSVLVSLSKRTLGLTSGQYTAFCQEDTFRVYSVMHKNRSWSAAPNTWRIAESNTPKTAEVLGNKTAELKIAPNPFEESFLLSSSDPKAHYSVRMSDMMGRQLFVANGTTVALNTSLAGKLAGLASGTYLLHSVDVQGNTQKIKIQKK